MGGLAFYLSDGVVFDANLKTARRLFQDVPVGNVLEGGCEPHPHRFVDFSPQSRRFTVGVSVLSVLVSSLIFDDVGRSDETPAPDMDELACVVLSRCVGNPQTLVELGEPVARAVRFEHHEVVIESTTRQTVVTGFLLGDAVADLSSVFSLEGTNLSSTQSTYEVHVGRPTSDGGTMWASDPDTSIRSEGRI